MSKQRLPLLRKGKNLLILIAIIFLAVVGIAALNNFRTSDQSISTQNTQQDLKQPATNNESTQSASNIKCSGKVIPELTEGPYYKTNTPQKTDLTETGIPGEKLVLTGYVLDTNCQPIKNAWIDFWQADGVGNYDNSGYKLRGHQYTEANGKYTLTTVIPGEYPGRTPHIHVKLRASENNPIITTQLFMPGEEQNTSDAIFDAALVMDVKTAAEGKIATYNFLLNAN